MSFRTTQARCRRSVRLSHELSNHYLLYLLAKLSGLYWRRDVASSVRAGFSAWETGEAGKDSDHAVVVVVEEHK